MNKITLFLGVIKMQLLNEYKFYVDGKWIESKIKKDIINPYNNEVISKVNFAEEEHLDLIIKSSQNAFNVMKNLPSYKRRDILNFIANEYETNIEFYAKVLSMECGKTIKDSIIEIERGISTLRLSAEESTRIKGEYLNLEISKYGEGREAIIKRFPIGPILGISPFNYPLNLAMHKIAPAIASGNTIVLKPASSTPLSCLLLAEIIDRSELPKGAVNIIPMDRKLADTLISREEFKLLTFTGSPDIGWDMKSRAGKKKVVLELGGNAGVIIDKDADLNLAAKRTALGAFSYQGQVCISVQRAYVHEEIFDKFSKLLIEEIKKFKIGDPLDKETDFTSMIDEKNAIRIETWVNEAVNNGAKIIYGGKRNKSIYEPTILIETDHNDKVFCVEAFGPILTLERFSEFNKAIGFINDSNYGLQAGIFTNDIKKIMYAFNELEVGGVIVNDIPTFRVDNFPYGGVKDSGFGREGVKYAIEDMTELKVLVLKK